MSVSFVRNIAVGMKRWGCFEILLTLWCPRLTGCFWSLLTDLWGRKLRGPLMAVYLNSNLVGGCGR